MAELRRDLPAMPPLQRADDWACLVGWLSQREYAWFLKTRTPGGQHLDGSTATLQWRQALAPLAQIKRDEAGYADQPHLEDLPVDAVALAEGVLQEPAIQSHYQGRRCRWHMVELDRAVISQKFINLEFVRCLQQRLSASPSNGELMRFAIGGMHDAPVVELMQLSESSFTFSSISSDLRFLGVNSIEPPEIRQLQSLGRAAGVLGIVIGYSFNFIRAYRIKGRLILFNGYHRAFALRDLGYRFVPCLVEDVDINDELTLADLAETRGNLDLYVSAPRPPVFKDFFDERVRHVIPVRRFNRTVNVQITVSQSTVPAL